MKTRSGFVTNSSSTSYIAVFEHSKADKKISHMEAGKKYMCYGQSHGGSDIFIITEEMLEAIPGPMRARFMEYFLVVECIDLGGDSMNIKTSDLPELIRIEAGDSTMHYTQSLEDFKDSYLDDPDYHWMEEA